MYPSQSLAPLLWLFLNNYAPKAQENPIKFRKLFYPSDEKTTRKLERIHSDICGQFPESIGNSVYMLNFLDDFTHWCWTVAIKDKLSSMIKKAFQDLIKQIENETKLKIKYLHTDKDGE